MDAVSPPVKRTRTYDATGRKAKAQSKHDRIVAIAERRFLRDGYGGTTIQAVADASDVSVDSIYKSFGGKAGLVRAVRDRALKGRGPVPAEQRSDHLHHEGLDGHEIIRAWGGFTTEVAPLVVPILLLVRDASVHDPEMKALQGELDTQRHERMTTNAGHLKTAGHLRTGVTLDYAADVLWTYSSPELYELLVVRRGWTVERYGQFIANAMIDALL